MFLGFEDFWVIFERDFRDHFVCFSVGGGVFREIEEIEERKEWKRFPLRMLSLKVVVVN